MPIREPKTADRVLEIAAPWVGIVLREPTMPQQLPSGHGAPSPFRLFDDELARGAAGAEPAGAEDRPSTDDVSTGGRDV